MQSSKTFGSQCIVSSIEAKFIKDGKWEVYIDNGRESTGKDVVEWAKYVEELGAGEIMLTSIDKEGTKKGFDIELYKEVVNKVSIPIIASGCMGKSTDAVKLLKDADIDAIASASVLHYKIESIKEIKQTLFENNIRVRI